MAALPLSFLSPSRCVLLITDDALCVYDVTARGATLLESVPWKKHDFVTTVSELIREEAGGKSVLVLNDAVEQHYRKEKVPRITMFDRASVVQRRLNVAFPNYPIKAALEIKDKSAKGFSLTAGSKDPKADGHMYLFAAIPASDAFARTLEAINRSGAGISGYCLLPIESSNLVKDLSDRLSRQKRIKNTAVWSVLIGQHHGGGLRQIVIKNGELALTRITPIVTPEESDAEGWCSDVAQEFQATLAYLSRFGYNPDDGLNVMVVAKPDLCAQIETLINTPCNYYTLTTQQAAQLLGISLGRDSSNHYADPLHAAWAGRKPRPILQLKSKDMDRIGKPRQMATAAMLLLSLGVGYFGFVSSNEAQAIYAANKNLEVAQEQRKKIEEIYQQELKRKESMGIDVKLIQGSIAIYEGVEKQKVNPLELLRVVADQLKNLRIDGFEFNNRGSDFTPDPNQPNKKPPPRDFGLLLKFSFAGTVKPQNGNAEIKDFIDRLAKHLPDYDVTIQKKLADLSYTGAITEETGLTASKRKASDRYEAEVMIKKAPKADDQGTGN